MSQEIYKSNYGEIAKRKNSLLGRLEEAFKKEMSFKVGFERW